MKNIVIFSDGTCNEGDKGYPTNVNKMYQVVKRRCREQVAFYDPGVGTDFHKITGDTFYAPNNLPESYVVCGNDDPEPGGETVHPPGEIAVQKLPVKMQIMARKKWTKFGVELKEGQKYRLSVTGIWYDASIGVSCCGYSADKKSDVLSFRNTVVTQRSLSKSFCHGENKSRKLQCQYSCQACSKLVEFSSYRRAADSYGLWWQREVWLLSGKDTCWEKRTFASE